MRARGSLFGYGLAAALMAMSPKLDAAICQWAVDGPGNWGTPANWTGCGTGNGDPTGTPGADDTAIIPILTPNAQVNLGQNRTVGRLELQAGTVSAGASNLTVSTEWIWTGPSAISGAGLASALTLNPGATATWSGATKEIRSWRIVNLGTIDWTQGELFFRTGSELENRSALNVTTALPGDLLRFNSDGAPQNRLNHVSGSSTLTVSGPGTVSISGGPTATFFDNNSSVAVTGGQLIVAAGGPDFGSYSIAGAATLTMVGDVAAGRQLGGSPAITGTGTLAVSSPNAIVVSGAQTHTGPVEVLQGALAYQTGSTVTFSSLLLRTGATLRGTDSFDLNGVGNWTGGTLATDSPGTTFRILPGSLLTVGLDDLNPSATLAGRTIINQQELRLVANGTGQRELIFDNEGAIDNQAFLLIDSNPSSANLVLRCQSPFPNCGSLQSAFPADITVDGGGGGPNRITADISVNLDGPLSVVAGEFDLEAQLTPGIGAAFFLGDGVSTPGLLRRTAGPLNVGSGVLAGRGTVVADVNVTGGTVDPTLDGTLPGRLTIQGNLTANSAAFPLILDGTSPATGIEGSTTGLYDQLAVTGSADLSGTVEVTLGSLFSLTPGDSFDLITFGSRVGVGSLSLLGPDPAFSLIEEPTRVRFAEAPAGGETCTWNVDGIGDWNVAANWDNCSTGNGAPAGTPGNADTAIIPLATPNALVNLVADRSVARLELQAGEIRGGNNLTILSEFLWSGPSAVAGAGLATSLIIDGAATATFSGGTKTLRTHKLVNFGTITWTAGDLRIAADAEFENRGSINMPTVSPGDLLRVTNDGAPLNRFHQVSGAGTIALTGSGSFVLEAGLTFDNGAEFSVTTGRMRFDADGTDFGTYSSSSGGTIEFGPPGPGFRELTGSPALAGDGVLRKLGAGEVLISGSDSHTGPVEVLDGELDYTTGTPKDFTTLTITNPGILGGGDDFTLSGTLAWNGGQIDTTNVGTATLTVNPGSTITVSLDDTRPAADLIGRRLVNQGSVLLSASNSAVQPNFWLQDGADIDNQGQFELRNNSTQNFAIDCRTPDCARFDNRVGATLSLNDINGLVGIRESLTAFDNAGTVELVDGCGVIGPQGIDTGTYDLGSTSFCTLTLNTPSGRERVFESSLILLEPFAARLQLEGRLRVNGSARSFKQLLVQPNATLYGPATITIDENALWRGRIEGGPGEQVLIGPVATVGTGDDVMDTPTLAGRQLVIQGSLEIGEAGLRLDGGAAIDNQGTLALTSGLGTGAVLGCVTPSPGCGTLQSFVPSAIQSTGLNGGPANRITSDIQGTVDTLVAVIEGELDFDAQASFDSSTVIALGNGVGGEALIRRASGALDLTFGGSLTGKGTVVGNLVTGGGTIDPSDGGGPPGRLTIQGNLTASGTSFDMLLDGTNPATPVEGGPIATGLHDQLVVTGAADLGGTVNVVLGPMHLLTPGDDYELFTFGSRVGTGTLTLGINPDPSFSLVEEATRVRYTDGGAGGVTCTWNPAGPGADEWSNPDKWDNCSGGGGVAANTPGPVDTAVIASGTVNLPFDITVGSLQFSAGVIAGGFDLTVLDTLSWTGGSMQGVGVDDRLILGSGAAGVFAGGQKTLDNRHLHLGGNIDWTTGRIELANGADIVIEASGVLDSTPAGLTEDIFESGTDGATLTNDGVINKLGAGTSGIDIGVQYAGTGAINANAGRFFVYPEGTFAGTYGAIGGELEFSRSPRVFPPAALFLGGSTLIFGDTSGTLPVNIVQGCFEPGSDVTILDSGLQVDCASPVSFLHLRVLREQSDLNGTSALTVTGTFQWDAGRILSASTEPLTLAAGSTSTFAASAGLLTNRELWNRHLINEGTIQWTEGNPTLLNGTALFENRGTIEVNLTQGTFADFVGGGLGTPRLWNTATGVMRAIVLTEQYIEVNFDNDGLYDLQSGRVFLFGPGTDNGSYQLAATTRMVLDSAVRTLGPTGSISGAGQVEVTFGADYTVLGGFSPASAVIGDPFGGRAATRRGGSASSPEGAFAFLRLQSGTPVSLTSLELASSGVLTSPVDVSVTSNLTWAGGTVQVGGLPPAPEGPAPALRLASGAIATIGDLQGGLLLLEGGLRIEGSASWPGGTLRVDNAGLIEIESGGSLLVSGLSTLACGDRIQPCASLGVAVRGLLRKTGTDIVPLQLTQPLLVDGALVVEGGQLVIDGVETRTQSLGVIRVAAGATLDVPAGLFLDGGGLTGGGQVNGQLTNIAGTVAPGTLLVPFGSEGSLLREVLTINGGYEQQAGGTLEINIGGFVAGSSADRLVVTGSAELAGAVVIVDDGFVPTPPDTYEFLNAAAGVTGTFGSETQPFAGYGLQYDANAVTLVPVAAPLVVNTTADPGDGVCDAIECTLRDAILAANGNGGPDVIEFAIPAGQCTGPGGACTIAPSVPLPAIFDSVIIDGYSQPGAAPSTTGPGAGQGSNAALRIEIDGGTLSGSPCLVLDGMASGSAVLGIATFGCGTGIVTQGGSDNQYVIAGNFLGLRADGSVAPAGQQVGVSVNGGLTQVGDGTPAGVNVIAGNLQHGISVDSTISGGPVEIRGNLIGTAPDGVTARPNALAGIAVSTNLALPVLIGGPLPDDRNIIAGNAQDGIRFDCPLSNGACFDGSFVLGNWIGVAVDLSPLGNGGNGVNVSTMASGLLTIGGVLPGDKNRIAHNAGNGVLATHADLGRLTISGNEIFLNGGLGIDLGGDGRTANDPGDGDTGPNGLQNFPRVTAYSLAPTGDSATLTVEIDTPTLTGNYPMTVDFYKADGDEPAVLLGSTTCPTPDTPCNAALSFPASVVLAPEDTIVVVATDGNGKSSEASFYDTSTVIEAGPDQPLNAQYAVQVTVTSAAPFVPLGTVDVSDDQMGSCVATLSASGANVATGSCLLTAVAPAGIRSVSGSYDPGNSAFVTSSGTDSLGVINLLPTVTTITGITPATSVVGQPYRVSVDVDDGKFIIGSGQVEVRQLNDGQTCLIDLAEGNFCDLIGTAALNTAVQARFLGEGFFGPSNSAIVPHAVERADTTITIIEDTPDPSLPGQAITVRFSVAAVAPGGGTPGGEVLITDGSASCGVTLPNLSCTFVPKATGSFVIEARYLGDANYNASTATTPHQVIASGADLGITKRNGLRILPAGQPSSYVILVTNAGPEAVVGARVVDLLPPELTAASWTCTAAGGASCPATGVGNIDALIDLPVGGSATFVLTVTAQPVPEAIVTNTATVATPTGVTDPLPANNSSSDTDPIGLFGDGLETESE